MKGGGEGMMTSKRTSSYVGQSVESGPRVFARAVLARAVLARAPAMAFILLSLPVRLTPHS